MKPHRSCWWCGHSLSPGVFAIVHDHDGNEVRVHKRCKEPASYRDYTACIGQGHRVLIGGGYARTSRAL